jgi:hypothetical protein
MRRVLLIAFHYPPMHGSSGLQRTYRFARYLRDFGWQPAVLTIDPRAYPATSASYGDLEGVEVCRAFGLDSARQLSLLGRYPGFIARPDRWVSWWLGGVFSGLKLIRSFRPDVLWSTYPIATAHLIGQTLARRSGLPWVADFRDPMAHDGYPEDAATWKSYLRIEQKVFSAATAATFTTGGALEFYRLRYPATRAKFHLIENGYDEEAFSAAEKNLAVATSGHSRQIVLLHSGVVYPQWRNPRMLFRAIRQLAEDGHPAVPRLCVRFRAAAHDEIVVQLAREENVSDFMELLPDVDYIEALTEMMSVDGLLLLQNAECNTQVPAKFYEYLRAGKPILALTDLQGDTAKLLRSHVGHQLADLSSADDIKRVLGAWLDVLPDGLERGEPESSVVACSRRARTGQLAVVLNSVLGQ